MEVIKNGSIWISEICLTAVKSKYPESPIKIVPLLMEFIMEWRNGKSSAALKIRNRFTQSISEKIFKTKKQKKSTLKDWRENKLNQNSRKAKLKFELLLLH